jgi:hypothetical protein
VVRPVEGGADRLPGSGAGCRDRRRSSALVTSLRLTHLDMVTAESYFWGQRS